MFQAQVFTLYPEVFPGPLAEGLYGKALTNKLWNLNLINIRDAATDKHKTVDDTPYGGGNGMLIKTDVLAKSLDENIKGKEKIIYLSPKGKLFDHKYAKEPGGHQDNQYEDLLKFIQACINIPEKNSVFLAIADGEYFNSIDGKVGKTRIQNLRDAGNNSNVFGLTSEETKDILEKL